MRVILQRIGEARVIAEGEAGPKAGNGLLALVGFQQGDHAALLEPMAGKIVNLRIFEDSGGRMNRSLLDDEGDLVLVSQFTLYADCRKGRRPGFSSALEPSLAKELFESFCQVCRQMTPSVITGVFGARMAVHLVNDGPVTILLDSAELGLG
jgi:D-tyrosyl-tRNA(Tyr) deacylase